MPDLRYSIGGIATRLVRRVGVRPLHRGGRKSKFVAGDKLRLKLEEEGSIQVEPLTQSLGVRHFLNAAPPALVARFSTRKWCARTNCRPGDNFARIRGRNGKLHEPSPARITGFSITRQPLPGHHSLTPRRRRSAAATTRQTPGNRFRGSQKNRRHSRGAHSPHAGGDRLLQPGRS